MNSAQFGVVSAILEQLRVEPALAGGRIRTAGNHGGAGSGGAVVVANG